MKASDHPGSGSEVFCFWIFLNVSALNQSTVGWIILIKYALQLKRILRQNFVAFGGYFYDQRPAER